MNGNDGNNCQTPQTACKTIGHAISLAGSGDSIIVAPATYTENLTIGLSLSVIGSGASTTIIDGNAAGRVVTIPNSSAQVTLSNITIRNGLIGPYGGGIDNWGTLTINSSTISGNQATAKCPFLSFSCRAGGGGIYNLGTLTIVGSTLVGNSTQTPAVCSVLCFATADGGGIFNRGKMIVSNSTLAGNSANCGSVFCSGRGGGISNIGTATINNSTISGNGHGGGISNNVGFSVTLQNSIVANNVNGNCGGVTSNGYNLSSDGTCNFNSPGDLNNHDPLLGPLQNNGGPTQTMALPSGSPAIDAGNPSGCTDGQGQLLKTDQRGQPRPDKEDIGGCDMGAFESQTD